MKNTTVKFIDLFAGIGGIRLGFEQAFNEVGITTECVLTSEIKKHAISTLEHNFSHKKFAGDIFNLDSESIPDFDFLLGGFPCQPFSAGGKRQGFLDTRGTLFFEIERILKQKKPFGFILENVEGLVKHDLNSKNDEIGRTLHTILYKLEFELGYKTSWKVFDSIDFGLPQSRKRIFIIGTKTQVVNLEGHKPFFNKLNNILQSGLPCSKSPFVKKLLTHFTVKQLYGKSIKDKRGGDNNIHSWDIELKGSVNKQQAIILNELFKQRRKKLWAKEIGIDWMDGMPLTVNQINSFIELPKEKLERYLNDLTKKGYLKFEHPKKLIKIKTADGYINERIYDTKKPKGYNIITGKLSFEINKILDPNDIAPTIVATDVSKLAVPDGKGLRKLTIREGLRLFGFPEWYNIPTNDDKAFDLLGNTVAIPVVKFVASKVAKTWLNKKPIPLDKTHSKHQLEHANSFD